MILDKDNKEFKVNGKSLKIDDKVLVESRSGDYETTVVKEFFSVTLEDNYTELKDSACLYAIKEIL